MASDMVHGWKCQKCGHEYLGLLQLHTCARCFLRNGYVLRWTEVTLDQAAREGLPPGEGWAHDVSSGRSRYRHDQG